MANVACSVCKSIQDSRTMQNCPVCYEYVCPDCANAYDGQCRSCHDEDDLPE